MSNYERFCDTIKGSSNPEEIFDTLCSELLKGSYDPELCDFYIDKALIEAMDIKETE